MGELDDSSSSIMKLLRQRLRGLQARLAALEAVTGIGPFVWWDEDLGKFFVGEPREFNGLPVWVPLAVADRAVQGLQERVAELEGEVKGLEALVDELEQDLCDARRGNDALDDLRAQLDRCEDERDRAERGRNFWARAHTRLEERWQEQVANVEVMVARLGEQETRVVELEEAIEERNRKMNFAVRGRVFELEQALLHVLQAVMGCQLYGAVSRKVEPRTDMEKAIVEIDQIVRGVLGDRDGDGETQDFETQDFASVRGQWRSVEEGRV